LNPCAVKGRFDVAETGKIFILCLHVPGGRIRDWANGRPLSKDFRK